jgi:hypothetical protein
LLFNVVDSARIRFDLAPQTLDNFDKVYAKWKSTTSSLITMYDGRELFPSATCCSLS